MSSSDTLSPVLLVDDSIDDLFLMRQRLLRAGVTNPILSFEDAEEAMAHLNCALTDCGPAVPGVVFLDLRMPRGGGFEVLKWIRAQPRLVDVRVVIVSTSTLPADVARARRLGAAACLPKYPTPEMLAEIVKPSLPADRARAFSDKTP